MKHLDSTKWEDLKELIFEQSIINLEKFDPVSNEYWQKMKDSGSEIWLDTGDFEAASSLWCSQMSALTTNNSLLNTEIQKGIYDELIPSIENVLNGCPLEQKVEEIAFALNAIHGLKLASYFGVKVSVELHTNTADNEESILYFGKRFHEIAPGSFIVKVPLTTAGLIGARRLKEQNIPINFTLGFSARQNAIITSFVKPDYVNVFLGRINAFVIENNLGDGAFVGELATLSSQNTVKALRRNIAISTKQIAASIRDAGQLGLLAGTDVLTIPTRVAQKAEEAKIFPSTPVNPGDIKPGISDPLMAKSMGVNKFWEVDENVFQLAQSLEREIPKSPTDIIERAREFYCQDMFVKLSEEEWNVVFRDEKIPKVAHWKTKLEQSMVAPDTLLNVAGLGSFKADQDNLDQRILQIIAK